MPDSVQAVDNWLQGLETGDAEAVVRWSHPGDQALMRQGLADRAGDAPTSLVALALPPAPLEHYFVEIAEKSPDGTRHVVLTELTLKNPLPYASKRVGQELKGIPKTRKLTTRFLLVRVPEVGWRVKLDLPGVLARAEFAEAVQKALSEARWADAAALLEDVPPPPDDPNALTRTDRLAETLSAELESRLARAKTSTAASGGTGGASPDSADAASNPAPD